MDGCRSLTTRSSGSEPVSLLCLLDRALGVVEGGSRNNLSSCNVFTLHGASPTNACASFAVIALEKPRPWDSKNTFRAWKNPVWMTLWADTHSHNDHAVLSDNSLAEAIERGVGVILERRQLRLEVIELHVRLEELRLVDRRWHKRDHGVVFFLGSLYKLRKRETV